MPGPKSTDAGISVVKKMAAVAVSCSMLLGVLGLFSYVPGFRVLGSVLPEFIPMAPSTAIFFITLGFIILACLKTIKPARAYFYAGWPCLVSLFGLVKFAEYCCLFVKRSFEQRIVPYAGTLGDIPVGTMSPLTGMAFFVAGAGTVFLVFRNAGRGRPAVMGNLAGVAGFLAAGYGFVFVLGYLYGAPLFYGSGSVVPPVLATSASFVFLGAGLALATGEEYFPLSALVGSSVRAMMLRVFMPLVCSAVLLSDLIQHLSVKYLPVHPNSVSVAAIMIILTIITALIIERVGRVLGKRIEELEEGRLRALLDLKDSEAFFSTQFEVANIGLAITAPDRKWVRVNSALCGILGYTAGELKQKTWAELTHPDDLNADVKKINGVISGEIDGYEIDKRLFTKAGAVVFVHLTVACVRNKDRSARYLIASVNDITEKEKAEERFRALFARHEAILAEIPDIVMEVDTNRVYTWANPAGYSFFGDDVIGKEAAHYFVGSQDTYNKVAPIFNGDEKTFYVESLQRRKDGEARLLAWWCRAIEGKDGKVVGALSSARDITGQRKNEEELVRYRNDLEKMVAKRTEQLIFAKRELHEARRLADIGKLSATLAHEIRNPLAGIKAAVYNIGKKGDVEVLGKHVDVIKKKVGECDHIIRNFLGYARIAMPKHEPIVIEDVLAECISGLDLKYPHSPVAVNVKFGCEKGQKIEADPFHMTQLLTNIIDNAYMAFEGEKGVVDILLECDSKTDSLKIHIKDNGCGIDEKNLPKLFEPFFTTRARGVGLGLSVCKQVVDLHGGTIEVKSRVGEGAEFIIILPLKKAAVPQ